MSEERTLSHQYKRILVPVDGSKWAESGLPHATEIARNHGAELIVLTAY